MAHGGTAAQQRYSASGDASARISLLGEVDEIATRRATRDVVDLVDSAHSAHSRTRRQPQRNS